MHRATSPPARLSFLIEKNLRILRQALRLRKQHDDPAILPHVSSVARYYRSFLDEVRRCHVGYNSSEFDFTRVAALGLIRCLIEKFETSVELSYDGIVWVRMKDAATSGVREYFMECCVSREPQMLSDRASLLLAPRIWEVTIASIQEVA